MSIDGLDMVTSPPIIAKLTGQTPGIVDMLRHYIILLRDALFHTRCNFFQLFSNFFQPDFFRVKFFVYIYYVIKVIDMIHLTNLYSTKYHQKHNEVLLKKLTDAGIMFSEVSRDNSRQIMVHPDEFEVAALVVLGWLSFINN